MNALIVQQLSWGINVGDAIARVLHRRGYRLSALVHGAEVKRFVDAQRDIPYEHVAFADPLYDAGGDVVLPERVRELEARYGLESLWRLIYSDRVLSLTFLDSRHFLPRKAVSNDYMLSVCWRTHQMILGLLDAAKPDWVLAPVVGSTANYLLYLACVERGIPFLTVGFSGFGDYRFIADDLYQRSRVITQRFHALHDGADASPKYEEARELYARLRCNDETTRPIHTRVRRERGLAWWIETTAEVAKLPARLARALARRPEVLAVRNIWMPANSRWNAARGLCINLRERFVLTDRQGECLRELKHVVFPYVYYPLHFEPEVSLLVYGPEYANQLEVCRRVALALPQGARLLVKEHPAMVSSRPRGFYDDLRGLVNVEVIHSSVASADIVNDPRCRASLVVMSSVGFEAVMRGRPVVLLAPAIYDVTPTAYPVASLEAAIARLREFCARPPDADPADVDAGNLAFLAAVLEHSFSLDHHQQWMYGTGRFDAEAFVTAVDRYLGVQDTVPQVPRA